MIRAIVIAAMIADAGSAGAQVLPDIDIKAHCNEVGGGKERIAACIAGENYARLWLDSHRIEPQILYACSHTLDLRKSAYVLLRSCVIAKSRH
jgi:hypothetical protein